MNHKVKAAAHELECHDKYNNLLECLEAANIEVHSHCRDGFCGVCRIKLKSGSINYYNGDPLAYVGENEILPCCCLPLSDIEIEVE